MQVELDWWQEHKVSITDNEGTKTIKAICTPCQHFSGRGILDRNKVSFFVLIFSEVMATLLCPNVCIYPRRLFAGS